VRAMAVRDDPFNLADVRRVMVRKTQQDAEITKSNILKAALEIIYEKGYARTTFVDIAQAIQLSKGAIYHHYKSKPEMFLALGIQMEAQIDTATQGMCTANATLKELQEMLYVMIRVIAEDPQLRKYYSIIFYRMEWTEELQPVTAFFDRLEEEMRAYIEGIFNKVQKQTLLPSSLDCKYASYALMAIVDGLLGYCLLETEQEDAATLQIAEMGLGTFFKGLQAS